MGCGWLGTPLAVSLVKKGFKVKGSTTAAEKLDSLNVLGITAYLLKLEEETVHGDITGFLEDLDVLILNIPPQLRRKPYQNFVKRIAALVGHLEINTVEKLLFVSSTSVYGEVEGEVTEETQPKPATEAGKQLLEAERMLMESSVFKTTVVRFGGLIGPNRHPITFLAGKQDLKNGEELINLIHLNDCITLFSTILEKGIWGELYNGVYPYHPTKKEYYTQEARKRRLPLPHYSTENGRTYKKSIKSKLNLTKYDIFLTPIS